MGKWVGWVGWVSGWVGGWVVSGWVVSEQVTVGTFRNQFRAHKRQLLDIDPMYAPFLIPTVTGHRKTACKEEQSLT